MPAVLAKHIVSLLVSAVRIVELRKHLNQKKFHKTLLQRMAYPGSRTSGRVRLTEIRSLMYWLKALSNHPRSICFFFSFLILSGSTTGLPISPYFFRFSSGGTITFFWSSSFWRERESARGRLALKTQEHNAIHRKIKLAYKKSKLLKS